MRRKKLTEADAPESTRDAGFTLVELIVAVMLLGVVIAIVSSFFVTSTRLVSLTQSTSQGTGSAANTMNELSRVIRFGADNPIIGDSLPTPAVIVATGTTLTMFSYVDSYTSATSTQTRPQIVQFTVDANRRIVEKRWLPSSALDGNFIFPALTTTPASSRIVGGPIAVTPAGGAPLFSYVSSTGATLAQPTGGADFTTDQLRSIAAISVTVRIGAVQNQPSSAVVLENTVRMPNLGFMVVTP